MVDGENKASLRSAVADGLLEYRRTCGVADADGVEVGSPLRAIFKLVWSLTHKVRCLTSRCTVCVCELRD